jgi:hypothetical protein
MAQIVHPKKQRAFRGHGGFAVEIVGDTHACVNILDGDGALIISRDVVIRRPEEVLRRVAEGDAELLIHFQGKSGHPAGDVAPVSWFNDAGRGLIRIVRPDRHLIILPLLGEMRLPHVPVKIGHRSRGPSRASDLWITVAAWCLPRGFSVPELVDATGISTMTVRMWIKGMVAAGLIFHDQAQGSEGKLHRYALVDQGRGELATFVRERWAEWKSGTGHLMMRPRYVKVIISQSWRQVKSTLENSVPSCFPSGVTVLEGGPGVAPRAWLMPKEGLVQELFLYVAESELNILCSVLKCNVLAVPDDETSSTSTLCVLPDGHPVFTLRGLRRAHGQAYPWPWGIAALDAIDHVDARVRQVAEEVLQEWIRVKDGSSPLVRNM